MIYKNHLSLGFKEVLHRDKAVVTSCGSNEFRISMEELRSAPSKVGVIPPGYEHRADKIADLFYEAPELDWLVCWTNNISDPFQQLNVGDRIRILSI
tara:strand:- start:2405 stop:2695 length:291 start_codon:yes stop_codon:yes gene_type:complete